MDLGSSLYEKLQNQANFSTLNRNQIIDAAGVLILNDIQAVIANGNDLTLQGIYIKFFTELFLKLKPCLNEASHLKKSTLDVAAHF
ncbi:hypothetical protein ACFORL_09910 [Legionella dresdenensis]|uniref:Uncharacterized protein n=1 Tax=Legionella dresdenensis TaxID=450200 RepID=A0ABV8CGD6_9GAMM